MCDSRLLEIVDKIKELLASLEAVSLEPRPRGMKVRLEFGIWLIFMVNKDFYIPRAYENFNLGLPGTIMGNNHNNHKIIGIKICVC